MIGIIFSLGSIGSMIAAFTATRISARFGIGPTTIATGLVWGPALLLVGLAPAGNGAIPFLVVGQLLIGFAVVVYNIVQVSYRQAICPPRLQGRMNSVMRFIVWGTIPVGAVVGGIIATAVSVHTAIWVGAFGMFLAVLPVLLTKVRTLRDMPTPAGDEPTAGVGVADPGATA